MKMRFSFPIISWRMQLLSYTRALYFLLLLGFLAGCGSTALDIDTDFIPVKSGEKWGYVNTDGKYLINPQFHEAGWFIEGLALVKNQQDEFGFINTKGELVINYQFKSALPFSEGKACVVTNGSCPKYIDKEGNILFEVPDAEEAGIFHQGLARVKNKEGMWGFIDENGQMKVAYQYDQAADFSDGLAAVMKWKKSEKTGLGDPQWGYLDATGNFVIQPQFKKAGPFTNGLAAVSATGKLWGYIDKTGNFVISELFDEVMPFFNGLAPVKMDGNWGYIHENGKYAVNPQFEIAAWASGDLLMVKSGNSWGFINSSGSIIINPQFDDATPYVGKYCMVMSGGKWGFLSTKGKFLAEPQFDAVNYSGTLYYSFGLVGETVSSDKIEKLKETGSLDDLDPDQLRILDSLRLAENLRADPDEPEKDELPVLIITASSYMKSWKNLTYLPRNVTDLMLTTWWSPGEPTSDGINSWLKLDFGVEREVFSLDIHNGSHFTDFPEYGDLYLKNNRMTRALLSFSDGSSQIIRLKENDVVQKIPIHPVKTTYILMRPLETARGSVWNDLCISHFVARGI